jgi:hypothetical protein
MPDPKAPAAPAPRAPATKNVGPGGEALDLPRRGNQLPLLLPLRNSGVLMKTATIAAIAAMADVDQGTYDVRFAFNTGRTADIAGSRSRANGLNRSRGRTRRLATRLAR